MLRLWHLVLSMVIMLNLAASSFADAPKLSRRDVGRNIILVCTSYWAGTSDASDAIRNLDVQALRLDLHTLGLQLKEQLSLYGSENAKQQHEDFRNAVWQSIQHHAKRTNETKFDVYFKKTFPLHDHEMLVLSAKFIVEANGHVMQTTRGLEKVITSITLATDDNSPKFIIDAHPSH